MMSIDLQMWPEALATPPTELLGVGKTEGDDRAALFGMNFIFSFSGVRCGHRVRNCPTSWPPYWKFRSAAHSPHMWVNGHTERGN